MYIQTNLKESFLYATANNDSHMTGELLTSKIAELIIKDKKDVVDLLIKYGDKVSVSDNENTIASKISIRGSRSSDFVNELTYLLFVKDGSKKLNASSFDSFTAWMSSDEGVNATKATGTLLSLGKTLVGSGSSSSSSSSDAFTQQLKDNIAYQQMMANKKTTTGMPIWGWVTIGVGTALAIGISLFFLLRKEHSEPIPTA